MTVDYLIIGQGISGTFLSYFLYKENKSFLVVDNNQPNSASRISAGIINPVTGRRMVTVWMAEELLPYAWKTYQEIGHLLGINAISQKSIIDFFPNPFMRESFLKRLESDNSYVHTYPEQNFFNPYFQYGFGCGEIKPAYIVHLETLLPTWRNFLRQKELYYENDFHDQYLKVNENEIVYGNIKAQKIIFCDGSGGVNNPWFRALPFAPNKGEALVLEIPDLPADHIYKKSMGLAPLASPGIFWVGSVYQWEYNDVLPTAEFRKNTELMLKEWLRVPFKIIDHVAGLRPATLERRPFVGMHPTQRNVGILNGMGTKGCSLAPYFARQLSDHLIYNMKISPEADIERFQKILTKNQ